MLRALLILYSSSIRKVITIFYLCAHNGIYSPLYPLLAQQC